ncbi:ricin-type beta-trefoil lectin domain protein [Micromonosporaceae bacterium Da 78-11]
MTPDQPDRQDQPNRQEQQDRPGPYDRPGSLADRLAGPASVPLPREPFWLRSFRPGPAPDDPAATAKLERDPFPLDEAYRLADDILAALAALHRAGRVRGGLEPSDVLLHDGRATLRDHGDVRPAHGEPAGDVRAAALLLYAVFPADRPAAVTDLLTDLRAELRGGGRGGGRAGGRGGLPPEAWAEQARTAAGDGRSVSAQEFRQLLAATRRPTSGVPPQPRRRRRHVLLATAAALTLAATAAVPALHRLPWPGPQPARQQNLAQAPVVLGPTKATRPTAAVVATSTTGRSTTRPTSVSPEATRTVRAPAGAAPTRTRSVPGTVIVPPAPAPSSSPESAAVTWLTDDAGKCVDARGADGSVLLRTCLRVPEQDWRLSDGQIIGYADKCLVAHPDTSAVRVATCADEPDQSWTSQDGRLANAGQCLTGSGPSSSDGPEVRLADCTGADEQTWTFSRAH